MHYTTDVLEAYLLMCNSYTSLPRPFCVVYAYVFYVFIGIIYAVWKNLILVMDVIGADRKSDAFAVVTTKQPLRWKHAFMKAA